MKYLAIDVGGTYTKYAVVTDRCEILEKDKIPTVRETQEAFLQSLSDLYCKYEGQVHGIAISTAGIVDSEAGFMHTGGSITCIRDLKIVEILEKRCQIPVTVENDAKCAALAEVWNGALKENKEAVVLVCGTGIGGALIHDRKVLRGVHNMSGEFSYIMTDSIPEYSLDHTFAGNTGIESLIKGVEGYTGISGKELDGEKIFSLIQSGNEGALKGLKEYIKRLAIQINNCQFIFDPEKIVIGGGISAQPLFIQLIREELKKINEVYWGELPIAQVEACHYHNDANLIGAVYVHLKKRESFAIVEA